ncbi:hypothetical protein ACQ9ZF_07490 [Cetobacterium somerae]|uniref:hypothetical protein n=1 Tax=Cetobacterium somerae TaxID=188913 RepID=UPI003D769CB0
MEFIIKSKFKTNFTLISNNFAQDKTLNLELRGFGLYLLSKPSDWLINPYALRKELNIGKDKVSKLLNDLIKHGYMFKFQRDGAFMKKGELKNIFYFSDDKELLDKTTEIFKSPNKLMQLSMSENPVPELPALVTPLTENQTHTNKDIIQNNNNKNITTSSEISIKLYLSSYLDNRTIANLLSAKPDITIEEFNMLYELAKAEKEGNYCESLEACLIRAAAGKWTFNHNKTTKNTSSNNDNAKTTRILKNRLEHFLEYYNISNSSPKEILNSFSKDCEKFKVESEELFNFYYNLLEEKLESN